MHYIFKKWDRIDTFAFTFGAIGLFIAITIVAGPVLAALFTAIALIAVFVLWLRA